MNESKISVRYAKALFALVREDNSFESLRKDMELLHQCIREIPELQYVIQSPIIKTSEKIRIFEQALKSSISELTFSFIKLVLQNRREEYLDGISRYFLDLIKTEQGIQPASIVTAIPLSDALRKSVVNMISKKYDARAELHEQVDPNIIGGYVLRVGDQQIDASISNILSRIKRELITFHS
jgi:F-type H+-transporting ATPase subunit delta